MFLSNWKMSSSSEKVKEVVYLGCCLPRENSTMWLARYIQSAFLIDFCFNHSSRLTFSIEIRMSSEIGEIFQSKTNLLDWKIFQSVERLKFSIFGIKRVGVRHIVAIDIYIYIYRHIIQLNVRHVQHTFTFYSGLFTYPGAWLHYILKYEAILQAFVRSMHVGIKNVSEKTYHN